MTVLVDTSVWSIALRRRRGELSAAEESVRRMLERLVEEGQVALLGAIRQELLTGIREERQFTRLRHGLRAFPDVELSAEDYEEAARLSNVCRSHGVAGGAIDFLICGVAQRRKWPILTLDADFARYARHVPLRLLATA